MLNNEVSPKNSVEPLTMGELLELVCMCKTQEQATWLFEELVKDSIARTNHSSDTAQASVSSHIGYVLGYLDDAGKRTRLHALFNMNYPIFGTGRY